MSSAVEIARAAWGKDGAEVPDWIERLAAECMAATQRSVAEKIGRSAGLVSSVLRNSYKGDMAGVEDAVRGAFMGASVTCPSLGLIPTDECQAWRRKARTGVRTNALRVRMINACQTCPRNQKEDAQ